MTLPSIQLSQEIPRPLSELEKFLLSFPVNEIRLSYEQTGTDTAETYLILRSFDWTGEKKQAELRMTKYELDGLVRDGWVNDRRDHATLLRASEKLVSAWAARKKFEASNSRDLRDYRRLYEKFGGERPQE